MRSPLKSSESEIRARKPLPKSLSSSSMPTSPLGMAAGSGKQKPVAVQMPAPEKFAAVKLEWSANKDGVPICTLAPGSNVIEDNVLEYLKANRAYLVGKYNEKGVLLFRGFPLNDWSIAEQAVMVMTDHTTGGGPLGCLPTCIHNVFKNTVLWVMLRLMDSGRKGGMRALGRRRTMCRGRTRSPTS